MEIIYQIIGFIGFGFLLYSLWSVNREKLLKYRIVGNLIIGVHYLLLGAVMGFAVNMITATRGVVYSNKHRKMFSSAIWVVAFVAVYIAIGIYNQTGIVSFLPVISAVVVSIALWNNNLKLIRISLALESLCWLTFAISVGSWSGISVEAILLVSAVAALIKLDILKKTKAK